MRVTYELVYFNIMGERVGKATWITPTLSQWDNRNALRTLQYQGKLPGLPTNHGPVHILCSAPGPNYLLVNERVDIVKWWEIAKRICRWVNR